jgi:hypothetical protein
VGIIRKLRHLKLDEKVLTKLKFEELYKNYLKGKRAPTPLYKIEMNTINSAEKKAEKGEVSWVAKLLICPLCKNGMTDPVIISSGKVRLFAFACLIIFFKRI